MPGALGFNIHEQLADYLVGKLSLRAFEDWFFAETWNIDQRDDLALASLVYAIKLLLAEFAHGDWIETELRSRLRPCLEKYVKCSFCFGRRRTFSRGRSAPLEVKS
jgi:hypothetical protein